LNIQQVSHDYDLPQSKCDGVDANCQSTVMEDKESIAKEQVNVLNAIPKRSIEVAHVKLWQEIFQAPVMVAFFDFDYCGDPEGIFGSYLFKCLHAAHCLAL
jgi:hypothetical protein